MGSVEAAKLLGATAFSALAFAPQAANHAIEHTSVEVQIAEFPAELSFYPGSSRLDVLNQASIYSDQTKADIGLHAKITGLPRFDTPSQLVDYFSPKRIDLYGSMADSPKDVAGGYEATLTRAAIKETLRYDLPWAGIGGLALYGGLAVVRMRRRIAELEGKQASKTEIGKLGVAGLAIAAVAGSLTIADHNNQQWLASAPKPTNLAVIHALDSTSLRGTAVDNPLVLNSAEKGITYAQRLKDRRMQQRQAYLATAEPALVANLLDLPDLRENEELLFTMTDMHSSQAGIQLARDAVKTLQQRYGKHSLQTVFNLGDMSYGADFQRQSVLDQALKGLGVTVAVSRGNHDVGQTSAWLKETDMLDLKGRKSVNGISVYGKPDVSLTPFLGAPYYPDPQQSETTLGQSARVEALIHTIDVVNLHEPPALRAFFGIPNISKYLESDDDEKLTSCDYGAGAIAYSPVALAQAGHWHDQYPIKMVCNQDGTWGVINVQGTGGGAAEAPTINSWSDPDGKPIKDVSFRAFIRNTKYSSITGVIAIQVKPDGSVVPMVRTDIGTPTGAPFPVAQ